MHHTASNNAKIINFARRLAFVLRRLRALFQRLAVPYPSLARVAGELEILGEFQRIRRARILAQPAEHAAAQIVGKVGEFLAAGLFVSFARNHDQMLGTRQRAQITRDAHGLVRVRVHVEPWRTSVTLGYLRPLQWILLGVNLFGILVAEGDLQPLKQVYQKDFPEQVWHAHNAVSIPLSTAGRNPDGVPP